jgi:predicted alpha/beta hydrolase family esterase
MKKVYLVHCWSGTSDDGWYQWLKKQLENSNVEVIIENMPNTDEPKIKEWVSNINSIVDTLNEDVFFIGHSIGCQAILRYLETKEITKIGGILFVAPWLDLLPDKMDEESIKVAQEWISVPINFDKIKKFTKNIRAIFSSDDYFVSLENELQFRNKLNAKTIIIENKGHISQDDNIYEEQTILEQSKLMLEDK